MASESVKNLDSASFNATLQAATTPVVVDFWAPWCGPCKAIAPILEEVAQELAGKVLICKVDVDSNNDLASQFNIRAIPTLLIFKAGKLVEKMQGMTSKGDLVAKIQSHV